MYIHKRTGQLLEITSKGDKVSTFNVLDSEGNTIIETNKHGVKLKSVDGSYRLKVAVCSNENVEVVKDVKLYLEK